MTLSRFEMVDFLLRKTKGIYINPEVRTYDVLEHVKATWPEEYEGIRGKLSNAYAFQVFELIEAADQGNISLAKLVLRFGINQRDLEECLYEAVKTGKSMAVATLLQRGVDPNARRYRLINKVGDPEGVEKSHPVKLALELGKNSKQGLDIIYLLIKAGADVNDELLVECGEVAAELEHPEFILLLSQRGYDAALFGLPLLSRVILDGSIYQCGPFLDAGVPISAYSTKYTFYVEDHNDDIWGPMSALQVAIFQGDLALVKYLVSRGGDVNLPAHDDSGRTTLQAAAERNRFDVVKWLVNAGADVKAPPAIHDGMTVLEAVAVSRDGKEVDPMFKYLLALGAPVNRPDGASGSVLHDLIRASRHECLGLVLDAGARVDSQEEFSGLTPLQVASERSDIEAVSMLLSHGSDINACAANEPRGRTALQAAAGTFCNVEAVVEFLLQKGADVNAPGSAVHGRTALQAAAEASSIEIVELLLRNGADVNAPAATEHGCTALQAAVRRSKIDTVELLLQNGADVNAPGSAVRGRTALQTAIETSSVEVVELLLQNGANVNTPATTEYGRTALQAATSSYHPDSRVVALLISSGADINAGPSAKGGVTALQGAAINGDLQIARILLHHGADVNADRSPDEGRTAVEGAAERGRLEMVRLLLSAGAMPDPVDGFLTAIKLADKNEHYAIGDLLEKFVESGQFLFTGSNDWLDENFYSSFAA
ncbi:hypothetical protein QQZ08_001770 [Neonectria magnoliae]|uniref:Ankyrin n=1 Tax=Neonectria magnoliae TaxID=2732573 RepID=A0ABR1IFK7_9HYPO